jgi:hypothetical protein
MEKRPLSLSIIAWVLVIFSLIGLVSAFTMTSNPAMMKLVEEYHMSVAFQQGFGVVNAILNLVVAYGIFKGLPWSRVLYLVWGIISVAVTFYTSPIKAAAMIALVLFVVVCAFLFTNRANEWFNASGLALKRDNR